MRVLALGLVMLAGCTGLEERPRAEAGGLVEPDVFDVIRASNSHAAVEYLRDQYSQELEQTRILEAQISELIAAEEALALQKDDEQEALDQVRREIQALTRRTNQTHQRLEELEKSNAELARKLQEAEQQRADAEQQVEGKTTEREQLLARVQEAELALKKARSGVEAQIVAFRAALERLEGQPTKPPTEPDPAKVPEGQAPQEKGDG